MPLKIFGLNHNTAPVEIREQVIFSGDDVARALLQLKKLDGIDEAVLLSTCNRKEFYVVSNVDDSAVRKRDCRTGSNSFMQMHVIAAYRTIQRILPGGRTLGATWWTNRS